MKADVAPLPLPAPAERVAIVSPAPALAERVAIVSPSPANDVVATERDDEGLRNAYIENPTIRRDVHVRFGVPLGAALKMIRHLIRSGLIPTLRNAVTYSDAQRSRAVEMVSELASDKEIAEATGMTRSQVAAIVKDEGLSSATARATARSKAAGRTPVTRGTRRATRSPSEDDDIEPIDSATPKRCASLGCLNLALRRGTCALHRPFDRTVKRTPVLKPEQIAAEIDAFIAAGKTTICPPKAASVRYRAVDLTPEPPPRPREPSMTREQRRELDWEARQIENRATSAHRGEFADLDPALVVGLDEAAIVVGVDIPEMRTRSDNREVTFRWRSGRRVFARAALEALRDRIDVNDEGNEIAAPIANGNSPDRPDQLQLNSVKP